MNDFLNGVFSVTGKQIGREVVLGMVAAVSGYLLLKYIKKKSGDNG